MSPKKSQSKKGKKKKSQKNQKFHRDQARNSTPQDDGSGSEKENEETAESNGNNPEQKQPSPEPRVPLIPGVGLPGRPCENKEPELNAIIKPPASSWKARRSRVLQSAEPGSPVVQECGPSEILELPVLYFNSPKSDDTVRKLYGIFRHNFKCSEEEAIRYVHTVTERTLTDISNLIANL